MSDPVADHQALVDRVTRFIRSAPDLLEMAQRASVLFGRGWQDMVDLTSPSKPVDPAGRIAGGGIVADASGGDNGGPETFVPSDAASRDIYSVTNALLRKAGIDPEVANVHRVKFEHDANEIPTLTVVSDMLSINGDLVLDEDGDPLALVDRYVMFRVNDSGNPIVPMKSCPNCELRVLREHRDGWNTCVACGCVSRNTHCVEWRGPTVRNGAVPR